MSAKVDAETAPLSAQEIEGDSVTTNDGEFLFLITDGEQAFEISHDIGKPEVAAKALDALADKLHEHAEDIRERAGRPARKVAPRPAAYLAEHNAHTGPGVFRGRLDYDRAAGRTPPASMG